MTKYLSALAASAAVVCIAGFAATSASAHSQYYPGCHCGPIAATTHVHKVETSKSETHFHDVDMTRHVVRVHNVTNVTEVQPIIHVHEVTRVHHHTIVDTRTAYHAVTEQLTPIRVVTHSIQNYYDCHCGM